MPNIRRITNKVVCNPCHHTSSYEIVNQVVGFINPRLRRL
mgnify:CR=1 FL=1